jgi:nitroreductase
VAERIPPPPLPTFSGEERIAEARRLASCLARRRSLRHFSDRAVPRAVIEEALRAAGSAPSGANQQPWHFVAVADPELKRAIRRAAEEEERRFYGGAAPGEWLEALAPLGTDEHKPFLEEAPWLIAVFEQRWSEQADGRRVKHYYATESVGIACGLLISVLHQCGLATLTHTPAPMAFLRRLLDRPASERPFLLLVAGHAAEGATVPDIQRRGLAEISTFR